MTSGSFSEDMNKKSYCRFIWLYRFISKLTICMVLMFSFVSCENDIEVIKAFSSDSLMPRQSMINAEITYTDSARLQLRITAPEIHYYDKADEKYTEFPDGVLAEFFDGSGNTDSQLSSKYAIHYTDKDLWEAKDSVVVINQAGEILNTEQLFWDERNSIIYSERFVKITRPNEVIIGEGFEADETFTRWRINKVEATIYLDDE